MKALLLALCLLDADAWLWDRNVDEDVAHYRVEYAYRYRIETPCLDPEGNPAICVTFTDPVWELATTEPQEPVVPTGAAICTMWDATPPLGAILYVNVRAQDFAGNVGN